jgi:DNA mismatch repair protein MutS2
VDRALSSELEFDKVLELVAAYARTGVGRVIVARLEEAPTDDLGPARPALLTQAVSDLIDDDGPLAFAGVDEAVPWLEPGAPPPSEPRDLLALLTLARRVAAVRRRVLAAGTPLLEELSGQLVDTAPLVAAVAPKLGRDGSIADNASPELARLRREISRARVDVLAELEAIRRAHPDVVTDAPPTLRRDRYCLPVRSSERSHLSGLLLDVSARGATTFVEPLAVVEFNNRLAAAVVGEQREIQRILHEIARLFADARDDLTRAVEVMAELDSVQARVLFGRAVDGRVVVPGDADDLVLRAARHPLLDERVHGLRSEVFGEAERRDPGHRVVALDFRLPKGVRTLVVSGPNAGGKTVVLKTIGLMVLMAMRGIPLPVEEGTVIPIFDHLWCHIGDEQDVGADLSTFSAAMAATARLLDEADSRTMVLFDELGAGTDPLEGAALGCALLEELERRGCLTVVSTHLAAIALVANAADGMDNAAMEYDEGSERPTYGLVMGRPGRSRALEIAYRMGVDGRVLGRARELLGGDHLNLDRWMRRLEALEQQLQVERERLIEEQLRVQEVSAAAERERELLEQDRRDLPEQLAIERERLRRRAKDKLDHALAELASAIETRETLGRRRLQNLRDEALRLELPPERVAEISPEGLVEGARVRVALGAEGDLREVRGTQARVEVSGKKLWVAVSELELLESPKAAPPPRVELTAAEESVREINLIGCDKEGAREELEKLLDRAFTAGAPAVRVVHGHGAGILRQMVADVCRTHPAVRAFRHPPQSRGGNGVTEVELEHGA